MAKNRHGFCRYTFRSWEGVIKRVRGFGPKWVFRGQPIDEPLRSTLERACNDADVVESRRYGIEAQAVLDFRRRCDVDDRDLVRNDTMYCMSVMQHFGAPTRLLDWTYSPFVALFFALETGKTPVLWCINSGWCKESASMAAPIVAQRGSEVRRSEDSFRLCYLETPRHFVLPENAFALNPRVTIQQGLFLCPGDVAAPFEDNLKAVSGWDEYASVQRFTLSFSNTERARALRDLYRMNISRASLFPGLDGFAQSLRQRMLFSFEGPYSVKGNA